MVRVIGANNRKPTTRKGKKFLIDRMPKIRENEKSAMIIHGSKTTERLREVLTFFYMLKRPLSVHLRRHNPFHIFDDETGVERFSSKYDASLFIFGSNQRKRPDTLIFGRMFDGHILDMFEMQIVNYVPASQYGQLAPMVGAKPVILLQGPLFETDETIKRLGNTMVDMFRGARAENIRLQGLETVISLTAVDGKLLFRMYRAVLKKSATKTPRVELIETGPSIDFALDRNRMASESLFKTAMRVPDEVRVKPRKNVSTDELGTKHARIHLGNQRLDGITTRHVKALKSRKSTGANTIPLGQRF